MQTIQAEGIDIELDRDHWLLYEAVGGHTISPLFKVRRSDNVMFYNPNFGKKAGLPGDKLSIEYVRAVLVGYQESSRRWILGVHIAPDANAKPVFCPLVAWSPEDSSVHVEAVRLAARGLALLLTCPLKVFGEKKFPSKSTVDDTRSGVTGPLEPHLRQRVEKEKVRQLAQEVKLPLEGDGYILRSGRSGPILQVNKKPSGGKADAPIFNMVEVNVQQKKVKLIPPTGLLGAFMSSPNKEIAFGQIGNVECRHVKAEITHAIPAPGESKTATIEQYTIRHIWGIFLTLRDESLLLVQTTFTQSPELMQARISSIAGNKFETNSAEGVRYFREHMQEQENIDTYTLNAEQTAYIIAEGIGCHVVKTEVEA